MKAPRCRLCGAEEWKHICGKRNDRVDSGRDVAVSAVVEGNNRKLLDSQTDAMPNGPGRAKQPSIASSATPSRKPPLRERRDYMRAYMAKRRAEAKSRDSTT